MNTYRIRDGFTVRLDERALHQGGAIVKLDQDLATAHAHKLEPVAPEVPAEPALELESVAQTTVDGKPKPRKEQK